MQDFLTFCSSVLSDVPDFLMSEPVVWFVGLFLVFGVAKLFRYITTF